MGKTTKRRLVTFWQGDFSWLEHLCLRSMQATGHEITIYSYDKPPVNSAYSYGDAAEIISRDDPMFQLIADRPDAPARGRPLFSDIFRYELLRRDLGVWVDTDMLFMKPLDLADGYIFGWESAHIINGAILGLPANSKLLADLLDFVYHRPVLAPWWKGRRRATQWLRIMANRPLPPEDLQWGVFGPKALSYFIKDNGLQDKAAQSGVYYPIHHKEAEKVFEADWNSDTLITQETVAVHLWNNRIKVLKETPPASDSFLGRKCAELNVDVPTLIAQQAAPADAGLLDQTP